MKALQLMPVLALGLAGCPGGDDGPADSGTDTDTTAPATSVDPTGDPTSMSETMPATTSEPPTSTTNDTTSTTDGPEESSSSSGDPLDCPYTPVDGTPGVMLELVADGFDDPLLVVGDPVENDVLYVVQKGGEIKRLEPGATSAPAENWLDLPVYTASESGLLGLAFHPDFENDPRIYVAHTPVNAAVIVSEFTVGAGGPDLKSQRDVIGTGQPADNHQGGMLQFGPDGMLYWSVGDGGPQGDACEHGQDGDVFMGKILRINPEADGTIDTIPPCPGVGQCSCNVPPGDFDYTIPDDNPFVGDGNVRDEIYAVGFRNPWRFSFDPVDDSLWVADVGQDAWEEVSVIEAGDNAGWGDMEGAHCFDDPGCDEAALGTVNSDGIKMPVAEYVNNQAQCSVTGLGNYRSCEVPAWDGVYFYADLCTGAVWGVAYDGTVMDLGEVASFPSASIFGGGYNAYGDVYMASGGGGTNSIYRFAPAE